MKRGFAFFENLIEKTFCGRSRKAMSRPYHSVAVWLAVPALLGGALTVLAAPRQGSQPGTPAGSTEQGSADRAQGGEGVSPQNLVPGQWTWMSGADHRPVYGTKGVASAANIPGARAHAVSWTDSSGNLWLFGGYRYSASSSEYLNDLWKWDGTNWTWVSGSNGSNQSGTYGTKGVANPANVPGARRGAVSWKDPSGNLWLFGGYRYSASSSEYLNDLWKWDGTNWTWVSGSTVAGQVGFYGTKGVTNPANVPGAREGAVSWRDSSGNLWLFGGSGFSASGSGLLNDVWKWDGTNWTWVSGPPTANQSGTYGTKGVTSPTNVPGARSYAVSWTDSFGNLWLFGGSGYSWGYGEKFLNDLWKWDGTNWTWVSGSNGLNQVGTYGTKGVASPANVPGGRSGAVPWTDLSGNLWLFGGMGYGYKASGWGSLNDLWKWDGTNWIWVSGSNGPDQAGTSGTKGVGISTNVPGGRSGAVPWTDSFGNFWLFGGDRDWYGGADLNDLWKWDGTNWTWVSGSNEEDQAGNYGTKGVPSPTNVPAPRSDGVRWKGTAENLWLFGGEWYHGFAVLNDLWKWDGTNWTWVSGSNEDDQFGTYGTKGVASPANVPGARGGAISWTDLSGNLWLFGGYGFSASGSGPLNDLWKWDGTNWTWLSGSNESSQRGTYGTKGVASPANVPGARDGAVSWSDSSGNFWLFGGGEYSDVWKWDGTNWTWVSGSNEEEQFGTYGTKGVASPANVPGGRSGAASWSDSSGNFWLFGGYGFSASGFRVSLNDLWKWDGANWTWVSGSNGSNQPGTYGTKGVANTANVPGARSDAVSWTDLSGNLWLFGGGGYSASAQGGLNDLWKWDGTNWSWVSGSNGPDQADNYGTKGVASPTNVPGAAGGAISWTDSSGNLWLFGGGGASGHRSNDLWVYAISTTPVCTISCSASGPSSGQTGQNLPFTSSATPSNCSGSISYSWDFGDGQTSGNQNPSHAYSSVGTYSWTLTASIGSTQCQKTGNVTISAPPVCTVSCSASGPSSGQTGQSLSFTSSATPSNCAGSVSYSWSFGDGGTASSQNPSHTYASAGAYPWTMTASSGGTTCQKSGTISITAPVGGSCSPNGATLCLLNGRFRVTADYVDYSGNHGTGHAQALTSDTGYFWFFNSSNVEAVVKMVSFCSGASGNVGVYAGGLTDLGVTLRVTDTRTNQTTNYSNPLGTGFRLVRDGPFGCPAGVTLGDNAPEFTVKSLSPPTVESPLLVAPHPLAACVADSQTLCLLDNRFQVRASYTDYGHNSGTGHAVGITSDTGYFWFFTSSNVEAVIKMVPFCTGGSSNIGVYAGGLTDLGVTLTVTDTQTGLVKTYSNALGHPFDLIRDGPFTCGGGGGAGQEITVTLPGGIPLVMVRIPAGTFQMGAPASEVGAWGDQQPVHQVTLTSDYYMGKYLVTQAQWQAVMGTAMSTACGSHGIGASYPVYCVSWNDTRGTGGFIEKLNAYLASTGQAGAGKFRLPTEAEWERAARGGMQTRFSFGDALECDVACGACSSADPYVWWCGNSGSTSHPVGTKQANPYGLFDMHGNLWEWCEDWYGDYGSSAQTDPPGPTSGSFRVLRGGLWGAYLDRAASAFRYSHGPGMYDYGGGFRLSRSP